ncbi:unnamed protein product [Pipistrellus nathusii]|uniref:Uncharacterized protein n=1 Tax=Pipistrellus nathusii TaxID=59473 RepID=A0ABP0AHR0_PIPNA
MQKAWVGMAPGTLYVCDTSLPKYPSPCTIFSDHLVKCLSQSSNSTQISYSLSQFPECFSTAFIKIHHWIFICFSYLLSVTPVSSVKSGPISTLSSASSTVPDT